MPRLFRFISCGGVLEPHLTIKKKIKKKSAKSGWDAKLIINFNMVNIIFVILIILIIFSDLFERI